MNSKIEHPIYLGTMGESAYDELLNLYEQSKNTNAPKIHYSLYGEWGSTKVSCGRYFTTDVGHTGNQSKVTCKLCLKLLTTPKTRNN